ncbi:hypothetical protein [Chitinophaga solisilvae]|uniref:hypothetical protein n=1 Tax=Chitinophaga solisilvae TaxID=1233460 RepID=UPI00136F8743|nr:hypothetical protein [Chitinophaga solisilvae]
MKFHLCWLLACLTCNYLFAQDSTASLKARQLKGNLTFLGAGLNYEQRIYNSATVNLEAQISTSLGYSGNDYNGSHWSYALTPMFSAEFRQYYNFARRQAKGKTSRNNAGNFFSFTAGFRTESLAYSGADPGAGVMLIPAWGIQRNWGKRISFEGRFGWEFSKNNRENSWEDIPNIRLSVGYVIF